MKSYIPLVTILSGSSLTAAFPRSDLYERNNDLDLWERTILDQRDLFDDDSFDLFDRDVDELYARDELHLEARDYEDLIVRAVAKVQAKAKAAAAASTSASKSATKAVSKAAAGGSGSGGGSSGLSPCPMMNTLNGAGLLPSTGITHDVAISVLGKIGFAEDLATFIFNGGVSAGKDGKSFDLIDLRGHGKVEHDGSISRSDAWSGNNWQFDPTRFSTFMNALDKDTLTIQDIAKARTATIQKAQADAKANGGTFSLSVKEHLVSLGEAAFLHRILSGASGTLKKSDVETFFSKRTILIFPPSLQLLTYSFLAQEKLPANFQPGPPLTMLGFNTGPMKDVIAATGVQNIQNMGQAFQGWVEAHGQKLAGDLSSVAKKLSSISL